MALRTAVDVLLISPMPPPYGGISHWTSLVVDNARTRPGAPDLRVLDTAPGMRSRLVTSSTMRLLQGAVRMCTELGRFVWELLRHRPAVIHLNTSGQLAFVRDVAMLTLASGMRVPAVYHLRFGRLADIARSGTLEWRWAKLAVARADVVIALDPHTEKCLRSQTKARKVVRIPNPVPLERIPPPVADEERRNVMLFVGWVIKTKGVEELLQAWERLGASDWTLELVGPADEDYLRRLKANGMPQSVRFLGRMDSHEVVERMSRSRVFVFPSHTEGFPNALAEAMASSMTIVASDVGAIGAMLDGGAGILVPPKNVDALVNALRHVMEAPAERIAMAKLARTKALGEFSVDRVFNTYVALWSELAAR